jgi:hypothetical protein
MPAADEENESPASRIEEWLKRLDDYCREPDTQAKGREQCTRWPSAGAFEGLMMHVIFYLGTRRVRWKTLKRLDKRIPSLRLVWRVNHLVKRAKARLAEAGESCAGVLSREAMGGRKDAESLLRDIARVQQNLKTAKEIDWTQHEKTLAQFSRTQTVELACGLTAPPEVGCYARALELIVENYRYELQTKPGPLIVWLVQIDHPAAQELLALEHNIAVRVKRRKQLMDDYDLQRKRDAGRERVRRHRAKNSLSEKRYTRPL